MFSFHSRRAEEEARLAAQRSEDQGMLFLWIPSCDVDSSQKFWKSQEQQRQAEKRRQLQARSKLKFEI